MKLNLNQWILIAIGLVFLFLATNSFRSQSWGVFVLDVGIVSIAIWFLFDQRRPKTDTENQDDAESTNHRAKGQ